jgi:tetrahydromethanopterin S-methyltransferase subunit G
MGQERNRKAHRNYRHAPVQHTVKNHEDDLNELDKRLDEYRVQRVGKHHRDYTGKAGKKKGRVAS